MFIKQMIKVIVYTHGLHHKPLKFIVPPDLNASGLLLVVRKRVKLQPHQAIFLFQGHSLINAGQCIATLPKRHGIIYIDLALENTFG